MKLLLWVLYNRGKTAAVLAALVAGAVLWGSVEHGAPKVKNLILVIGDGMGPQEVGMALAFAREAPGRVLPGKDLNLEAMMNAGVMGLMRTSPHGFLVTDSGASGTQIATGRPSRPGMIGVDYRGDRVETILEKARRAGKLTALISDTRITHATPASFAAHVPRRSMENKIALQLAREGAHIMLSGGLRHWLPSGVNSPGSPLYDKYRRLLPRGLPLESARKDDEEPLETMKKRGYELVFDRERLRRAASGKILGLFAGSGMPDGIRVSATRNDRNRTVPTLREMTRKALELLSGHEKGFFLMVEAGYIDWAGHHSDAGRMIHEMMVLDETLGEIMKWAAGRNDTLVIVTADHETGSFGFSYHGYNVPPGVALRGDVFRGMKWKPNANYVDPAVLAWIYGQKKSFEQILREFDALPLNKRTAGSFRRIFNEAVAFPISHKQAEEILATVPNPRFDPGKKRFSDKTVPLIRDFSDFHLGGAENRANLMGRAIASRQGVVWATGTHTATPVMVIAWGPVNTAALFAGAYHSTDLNRLMTRALGLR